MTGLHQYERDAGLPALAGDADLVLPDEAALLPLVRAHLRDQVDVVAAECRYARWKPGTSLSACYRVVLADGGATFVTYKRYAGPKIGHLRRHLEPDRYAGEQAAPLRAFAALREQPAVLYAFPFDRELDGLSRLLDLRRTGRLVREAGLLDEGDLRWRRSAAEVLRYKPERRAVARLDLVLRDARGELRERRLAARVLPPDHAEAVARRRGLVERSGDAPAPRLLLHERRPGLLLEEWWELGPTSEDAFHLAPVAGELLARLHAAPLEADARPRGVDAPGEHDALFAVDAALAPLAARVAPEPAPRALGWVHGDFHPNQVAPLVGRSAYALLDLDELRAGAPSEDLAAWIADHLAADPCATPGEAADPLLDGYQAGGGAAVDERELLARVRAELVRQAAAAVRRLERGAPEIARRLLERALAIDPDEGLDA